MCCQLQASVCVCVMSDFRMLHHFTPGGGGTDLERGYGHVPRSWPPFFRPVGRGSLAYQFTIIAPLLCPPFSNFRKFFHFQPCFGQNFSSQDANFPNFRSLDPSFFKENPLPRPYFWKFVWHIPTKKKVECPPGILPGKLITGDIKGILPDVK